MKTLQGAIDTSSTWLLAQQDDTSGGWPDRSGMQPNALNTAESILALIDSDVRAAGANEIQSGVKYLLEHQISSGDGKGAWGREVHYDNGSKGNIVDLVRTAFCIQALIKAGVSIDREPTSNAVTWLINKQNADCGWGYADGQPSDLMPTSFALSALLDVYEACHAKCKTQIESGLEFLIARFYRSHPDDARGSFGEIGPQQAVHTVYTALVLQKARKNKLSKYGDEERRAIDWVLRHPDDANRLVEESVTIDVPTGRGDYGFLYMTDTLLLRLLTGSDDDQSVKSRLARDAITHLMDRQDRITGAFYGHRVFSWSTAKSLSALAAAKALPSGEYEELPRRVPEHRGPRAGTLILVLVVIFTALSGYLMSVDRFGLTGFLFYALLIIVCLFAVGLIGERSFVELFKSVMSRSNEE